MTKEARKSAGILFTDGKQMLLLKRAEGSHSETWGLPGGHAKPGETARETAERESMEETGLDQVPGTLIKEIADDDFTTFIFKVKTPFICHISDEHSASKWVPFQELKGLDLHPGLSDNMNTLLTAIRKGITHRYGEWLVVRLSQV